MVYDVVDSITEPQPVETREGSRNADEYWTILKSALVCKAKMTERLHVAWGNYMVGFIYQDELEPLWIELQYPIL